jgi:uncharacterized protein YqgV (UPF0045/DUF77 family)
MKERERNQSKALFGSSSKKSENLADLMDVIQEALEKLKRSESDKRISEIKLEHERQLYQQDKRFQKHNLDTRKAADQMLDRLKKS